MNRYNITHVPEHVTWDGKAKHPHEDGQPDAIVWSTIGGFERPPAVGERITVAINGFGVSTVTGYFVEHGYLGVQCKPDKRPDWHKKQQPGRDVIMVFGAEVKP